VLLQRTAATRGQVIYPQPADNKRLVGIDADETAFIPSPLEVTYFEKTLALFAAAHVRVLLLTIPAGDSTIKALDPKLRADFSRFLTLYADRYNNITPAGSGLLAWPDDFYVDGSHMNEHGAKVFTARLASCLRQWDDTRDHPASCSLAWDEAPQSSAVR